MGGVLESFEMELNPDHMQFVRSAQEKYDIGKQDKVMRIIMDYIITTPSVHDEIFTEIRCLRCD
ncbi:MAG: hypothetical protein O2909_10855 [Chloroflexi bacterium]|nr:hypothetical protein [Chloroflexota bacterium]MDA1219928.1 hypothetical protein [Chloroflexota bacterium]PKB57627.1 MAG: hypothetical protein BZY73_02225 [SAR202 cluster bacterium Casp-Chloro-G3]